MDNQSIEALTNFVVKLKKYTKYTNNEDIKWTLKNCHTFFNDILIQYKLEEQNVKVDRDRLKLIIQLIRINYEKIQKEKPMVNLILTFAYDMLYEMNEEMGEMGND